MWEVNEAFSLVVLATQMLEIDPQKWISMEELFLLDIQLGR